MKHADIENLTFFVDPETKNYIAIEKDKGIHTPIEKVELAFGARVVHLSKFEHLFASSPMLYQQLSMQYAGLQHLLDLFEMMPPIPQVMQIRTMLTGMQDGVLLAQQVAQTGLEAVSEGLTREQRKPT